MDTPKVGDIVRVVLEGRVDKFWDDAFDIGGNEANTIWPGADHVKSIEILKPPKPSVADLPAWAVVKNKDTGEIAQRQAATGTWVLLDGGAVTTREIDAINWVHLVEKSNG